MPLFPASALRKNWPKKHGLPPIFGPLFLAVAENRPRETRGLCLLAARSGRQLFRPLRPDGVFIPDAALGPGGNGADKGILSLAYVCDAEAALDAAVGVALELGGSQIEWLMSYAFFYHADCAGRPDAVELLGVLERLIARVASSPAPSLDAEFLKATEVALASSPSAAGAWRQGRALLLSSVEDEAIYDIAPAPAVGEDAPPPRSGTI